MHCGEVVCAMKMLEGIGENMDGFDSVGGAFHMEFSVLLMF